MSTPFNPLDHYNLARAVASQIEESELLPLDVAATYVRSNTFPGAGVYAIYYDGDFEPYSRLAAANADGPKYPIYVGQAIPEGGRMGLNDGGVETKALSKRLREHRTSIIQAENLDIAHFQMRWLIVEDIWITLGESAMIRRYRPVWNAVVDGFGNHNPGSKRVEGLRSQWDTIHPGRSWAHKFPARPSGADLLIAQDARQYLDTRLS
ncbi:Eco29kI family restriction endonuclease [Gordonia lacunae]|uniref:Restriction endonuclease n=1 Tax=Gordonia lacunae TaxID=417102 RepID=A0A243QD18_9ACTN|nr:Eco29kI family restriction endonuclease [Gordonia lacunae]OUC79484.1 restriction endonuclease [Gordonia lacunae]